MQEKYRLCQNLIYSIIMVIVSAKNEYLKLLEVANGTESCVEFKCLNWYGWTLMVNGRLG